MGRTWDPVYKLCCYKNEIYTIGPMGLDVQLSFSIAFKLPSDSKYIHIHGIEQMPLSTELTFNMEYFPFLTNFHQILPPNNSVTVFLCQKIFLSSVQYLNKKQRMYCFLLRY